MYTVLWSSLFIYFYDFYKIIKLSENPSYRETTFNRLKMRCVLALAFTILLVSASPPNDDADATQRVVRFGLNARFFNQLKKQKEKQTGKMHCKILLALTKIKKNLFFSKLKTKGMKNFL